MLQELASNQKEVNNSNNVGMIPVASEEDCQEKALSFYFLNPSIQYTKEESSIRKYLCSSGMFWEWSDARKSTILGWCDKWNPFRSEWLNSVNGYFHSDVKIFYYCYSLITVYWKYTVSTQGESCLEMNNNKREKNRRRAVQVVVILLIAAVVVTYSITFVGSFL